MSVEQKDESGLQDRKEFVAPEPSEDLAWILGVFSVAGSIKQKGRELALTSRDVQLIDSIDEVGRSVFGVEPARYEFNYYKKDPKRKNSSYTTCFFGRGLCDYLGDLSKENWVDTVTTSHEWIFGEEKYLNEYLSGIFDARGTVQKRAGSTANYNYYINISINKEKGAVFVGKLLKGIGISNIRFYANNSENNLGVIRLHDVKDISNFASRIKPRVGEKAEALSRFHKNVSQLKSTRRSLTAESEVNLGKVDGSPDFSAKVRKPQEERLGIEEALTTPSHKLAWYLGLLVASGGVYKSGSIKLMSKYPELLEKFSEYSEMLFNEKVYRGIYRKGDEKKEHTYAVFNDRYLVGELGDLKEGKWIETIMSKYSWLPEEDYLWDFFSAFLDSRGRINDIDNINHIYQLSLYHNSDAGCEFVIGLLRKVNILSTIVLRDRGVVKGVTICRKSEIIDFAQHVHSSVKQKEDMLQKYRIANPAAKEVSRKEVLYLNYEERVEAYQKILRLRKEFGWGATKIAKHPDIVGYKIPLQTICYWISGRTSPFKPKSQK